MKNKQVENLLVRKMWPSFRGLLVPPIKKGGEEHQMWNSCSLGGRKKFMLPRESLFQIVYRCSRTTFGICLSTSRPYQASSVSLIIYSTYNMWSHNLLGHTWYRCISCITLEKICRMILIYMYFYNGKPYGESNTFHWYSLHHRLHSRLIKSS